MLMEQYLKRFGYEVTACRSGQEAWELFEADPAGYSMVLADIIMPNMSGKDLLLKMFELNPAIRIIICTGYPFDIASLPPEVRSRTGLLQKPFAPRMLVETVEQLFAAAEEPEEPQDPASAAEPC